MAEFKDRLRELRKEKGLTQQELADFVGINRSTFPLYELGKREPVLTNVIPLANYFQVTTDYLLGLTDERKQQQVLLSDYSTDELMREVLRRWL